MHRRFFVPSLLYRYPKIITYLTITIDGKIAAATLIVPAVSSKSFVFTSLPTVTLTGVDGAGTPPTVSIGSNASDYNNAVTAASLAARPPK